jgi:hypothetical protein
VPVLIARPPEAELPCDGSGVPLVASWLELDFPNGILTANHLAIAQVTAVDPGPDGCETCVWYYEGELIPGAVGPVYVATRPGVYWAEERHDEEWSDQSNPVFVHPCDPGTPPCVRADVSVVIYGGWDGIPVSAFVGGTEQEMLYTALDASGEAAVLWTLFPPENESWLVSIAPQTPPGKDAAEWEYKLVRIVSSKGLEIVEPPSAVLGVSRCSEYIVYFQLVHTAAAGR